MTTEKLESWEAQVTAAGFRPERLILLAICVAALWRVWDFFQLIPAYLRAPYQFDYEEGNILNALLRITQGATPYPDPHALPNIINPYGPVAYYLLVLPVKIFGLAFLYPRAMILGCAIVIALFLAIELRRATHSFALAVTFGLIYLSIPNIQEWAWLLRADLLGIAFTAAGLVAFSRQSDRERVRTMLPALLFAAGLLVKPTLIAAPAACFFALVARRRYRDAVSLAGVTVAVFGLVLALFAAVTRGAVLLDIFLSHPDPFSLGVYAYGLTHMLTASWPLMLLAAIAIAHDLTQRRFSPAILWLVFATATAITAGKLGSNQNHFLEWNTALCLAAGLGLDRLISLHPRTLALATTAIAIGATTFVISTSRPPRNPENTDPERGCPQAYAWVRTQAGDNLLTENVGALVLGNKKVWVSNPFVLAQLVEHSGWSDAELVRMVRERRFDAVLTKMDYAAVPAYLVEGTERFSPQLLRALAENYAPEPMFQCKDMNIVYRPKAGVALQSPQVPSH